jgi:pimeloyl-ACP methyl ester carboxylesterase
MHAVRRITLVRLAASIAASLVVVLVAAARVAPAATTSFRVASASPAETRVSFRSGANTLSGILSLPAGGERHAAVVLLSGSDRGGTTSSYLVEHARILAGAGFAVLRYDPPGVGRSTGSLRLETFDDRAREAVAAVNYLRTRPELRPGEIGLWGHSQGGWITQMAAARSRNVAFIVSVSGSGVSAAEQEVFSVEAQSRAAGFPALDIAKAGLFARLWVDWQLTRPVYRAQNLAQVRRLEAGPWSAFATLVYTPGSLTPAQGLQRGIAILRSITAEPWARYLFLDTAILPALQAIPPGQLAAAKAAAQRSLLAEPKKYLTAVHCPVLAIWGEDDTLVPARKSSSLYRQYLKAAGNHDVTIVVVRNADHDIRNFGPAYRTTLTGWLRHRFAT